MPYNTTNMTKADALKAIEELQSFVNSQPEPTSPYDIYRQAMKEGKVVEFRWKNRIAHNDDWEKVKFVLENHDSDLTSYEFRIAPEPKYRAWKPEEVIACWVRQKKDHSMRWWLGNVCQSTVGLQGMGINLTLEELLKDWEGSTNVKNWSICGVLEEEKE